jgi:acyl carrier protein
MDQEVLDKIMNELVSYTGKAKETIREDSNLTSDLMLSSLDKVDLLVEMEDAFHISFDESEVYQVKTVGDVLHLIEAKKFISA